MVAPVGEILKLIKEKIKQCDCNGQNFHFHESAVDAAPSIGGVLHFDSTETFKMNDDAKLESGDSKSDLSSTMSTVPTSSFAIWAFAPNQTALIYARDSSNLKSTASLVPGFAYGEGVREECVWTGTRDYTPWLTLQKAAAFNVLWRYQEQRCIHGACDSDTNFKKFLKRDSLSGETHPEFCFRRARESAAYQFELWGTKKKFWDLFKHDEIWSNCVIAKLPDSFTIPATPDSSYLRTLLRATYKLEVSVGWVEAGNGYYLRLSYAVYNTQSQIQRLGEAFFELERNFTSNPSPVSNSTKRRRVDS